jgi:hypothetical protein
MSAMKRFALLSACLVMLSASTGCCCFPFCGGGYGGACGYQQPCAPCSPCSPGYGAMMPTSAYYPGASISAGLAIGPGYAAAPYPVMAAAPLEVLPTY